ncbi:MAG TPA: alanine racemase [Selenomonadales bacterium]|nr:alanine racemase [Selenomonadales bacterium]
MNIADLVTPNFLVDLDILETNIGKMAAACKARGVALAPMTKTHKSTVIAGLQRKHGAGGFLTGTLDEAEGLVNQGFDNITLAYPVAGRENVARVAALAGRTDLTICLDGAAAARELDAALSAAGRKIRYLIIVDCGLGRFGVAPEAAPALAAELASCSALSFRGISTHPGQAYAASGPEDVARVAQEEIQALAAAKKALAARGFSVPVVATGSTPTAEPAMASGVVTVLRPGNYVFFDNIQMALGVATEADCSLTVLATVISRPRPDTLIIDAGSKCLGLDKGAHGNALLAGFGLVKGHPELLVAALSEEVGKVRIVGPTTVTVGDKLEIIPNHACSVANMTSSLIGHRRGLVERSIPVDLRGGTRQPPV